jgi:peroxiredoxin/mono/diheme cytochrome c family protein
MSTLGSLLLFLAAFGQKAPADSQVFAGFKLQDFRGASHALDDVRDRKVVVLAFLGVECPLANQYAPRLVELVRSFEPKGVAFFAIDANQHDGPAAMGRFANANDLLVPFLKDVGNELADQLAVERTPEVIVLDAKRAIRYRGRIDDQFALGVRRTEPTRRDLAVALDELLAGKEVSVARTEPVGCRISRVRRPGKGEITYAKQIAQILGKRCAACHRPREIAPFSLTTYKQAAGWAETIAEVVRDGRMPPWHASPEFGKFRNDAHLSDDEKRLFAAWVADGAPEGDSQDGPALQPHSDGGWRIPKPDLVIELPRTVDVPAQGTLPYQYFEIDPKFDRDVYIRASQVRPGNPAVLHHLVVFAIPPGRKGINPLEADFVAGYSPGMPPRELPPGAAKIVPAGSKLLVQAHYTPRGTPQSDRSKIGFAFTDPKTVRKRMISVAAANDQFRIPPGASDFQAVAEHRFNQDYILYALMPHMHLRGKSFRFEATFPDGRREVLLDVPHYEFDWQNAYILDEPKPMPEGTIVRCVGRFDNSADNPNNPDPKRQVTFGEQTNDEMLIGYMDVALDYQDLSVGPPRVVARGDGQFDVTFRHRPPQGTRTVHLAASFHKDYSPVDELEGPDQTGFFTTTVVVPAGEYKYKYVHDGNKYRHDPANWRQIDFFNDSVLSVREAAPHP